MFALKCTGLKTEYIMIDGIKFSIDPEAVRYSDVLDFKSFGNRHRAKYNGLIIDLYEHSCYVRGSIHKYSNNGLHNANDFTLLKFIETLHDLCLTLNIKPERTLFHSIEFGVNLEIPNDINHFINSVVFCRNGEINKSSLGIEIPFTEYRIKLYKKVHKGVDLLRYEVSIRKSRRVKNISKTYVSFSNTLADLTNYQLWKAFANELLTVYDDILIVDVESIDMTKLKETELMLFINGSNSEYWLKKWTNRTQRSYYLNQFKQLLKKHSTNSIKNEVRTLICDKINTLIDIKAIPIYTPEFVININNKPYAFTIGEQSKDLQKPYAFTL